MIQYLNYILPFVGLVDTLHPDRTAERAGSRDPNRRIADFRHKRIWVDVENIRRRSLHPRRLGSDPSRFVPCHGGRQDDDLCSTEIYFYSKQLKIELKQNEDVFDSFYFDILSFFLKTKSMLEKKMGYLLTIM